MLKPKGTHSRAFFLTNFTMVNSKVKLLAVFRLSLLSYLYSTRFDPWSWCKPDADGAEVDSFLIFQFCWFERCISVLRKTLRISVEIRTNTGTWQHWVTTNLASNQAQPLLIWWRRDLGLGASKNRPLRFQSCEPKFGLLTTRRLHVSRRRAGSRTSQLRRCTCMLTMLNSEKTLVLYVLRLGRFVSSMLWCLESALRRCELRHSVTLKAELRRSIEVVLAGHHFVADLSTWFREVTDLSAASFCFDDQSGGILVLLKKKSQALSLTPFLPLYNPIELCSFLSWKKKKKKKKKRTEGGSSSSEEDRYICAFW